MTTDETYGLSDDAILFVKRINKLGEILADKTVKEIIKVTLMVDPLKDKKTWIKQLVLEFEPKDFEPLRGVYKYDAKFTMAFVLGKHKLKPLTQQKTLDHLKQQTSDEFNKTTKNDKKFNVEVKSFFGEEGIETSEGREFEDE